MCASLKPPLRQNLPWWRSAKNEAVLRQLVNVLTRRCRGRGLEGGVLDLFKRLGTERVTVGLYQKPMARVVSWRAEKVRQLTRKCCRDLKRITGVKGILLTGLVVSFCGAAGPQERVGEKVELASGYSEPAPVGSSRGCGIFSIGCRRAMGARSRTLPTTLGGGRQGMRLYSISGRRVTTSPVA